MEAKSNTATGHDTIASNLFAAFSNGDVGSPALRGSARQVQTGWDLTAGGVDIWEKVDQFHFVSKMAVGDFEMVVRIESFKPAHLYSKAGLMIRETLDADSRHWMFLVFSDNSPRNNNLGGYEMQFRAVAGGDCQAIYPKVRPPAPPEFPVHYPHVWLRVKRQGDRFSGYVSTDGKAWTLYGEHNLQLPAKVQAGPAVCSHNAQAEATVQFRDFADIQ